MTIVLAPVLLLASRAHTKWREWSVALIFVGILAVVSQREFLPWYWVWIMPLVALLPSKNKLTLLAAGVSMGLLLRYAPYLYKGDYNPPVPAQRIIVMWVPIVASFLLALKLKLKHG
jgi:hypothetical protein